MPPRYRLHDLILIGLLFRVYKMKIAALCAFAERSSSFKAYLRHKPGKGDIIIFAIYLAKFGTTVLNANILTCKKGLPYYQDKPLKHIILWHNQIKPLYIFISDV